MSYPIEIALVGWNDYNAIQPILYRLNSCQEEFSFELASAPHRAGLEAFEVDEYLTEEAFARLLSYRESARGHRPFLALLRGCVRGSDLPPF